MTVLDTLTLGDVDILLLDASPLISPVDASHGSLATVIDSGLLFINQLGIWELIGTKSEIRNETLPKYLRITNENIINSYTGDPKKFKIEVTGDGEILILNGNNSVIKTISDSGFVINTTNLRFKGQAINNGRLDTLSFIQSSLSLNTLYSEGNPREMWMSNDGVHVYFVGTSRDTIYHLTLPTPYDISTLVKQPDELRVSSYDGNPSALFLSPDRNRLYMCGTSNRNIEYFTLTNGDLTTAVHMFTYSVTGIENTPHSVILDNEGRFIYFIGSSNDRVFQYSLGTPWDLSTIGVEVAQFIIVSQEGSPTGLSFNADGSKLYMTGSNSDRIFEYKLGVPWMIESASYTGRFLYIGTQESSPNGVFVGGPNGDDRVYIVGTSSDRIHEYHFERPLPDFEITYQEVI